MGTCSASFMMLTAASYPFNMKSASTGVSAYFPTVGSQPWFMMCWKQPFFFKTFMLRASYGPAVHPGIYFVGDKEEPAQNITLYLMPTSLIDVSLQKCTDSNSSFHTCLSCQTEYSLVWQYKTYASCILG